MTKLNFVKHPQRIVLYSRPLCGWCIEAKDWLDDQGLAYISHNVGTDTVARKRAIELSGQPLVPVIEVDDHVLGDFDVDQLQVFLRENGYLPD
jgi:glutaredoxin